MMQLEGDDASPSLRCSLKDVGITRGEFRQVAASITGMVFFWMKLIRAHSSIPETWSHEDGIEDCVDVQQFMSERLRQKVSRGVDQDAFARVFNTRGPQAVVFRIFRAANRAFTN